MNLKKYDNKCVQIYHIDKKIYEGICTYDDKDYCFHEYGKNEECLEIFNTLFYKSQIKKIKSLENNSGPYGKFTEPFGEIEKLTVELGIDSIEEGLESEENEHVYRLLLCLEQEKISDEIIDLLKKLIKYNDDDRIIKKAKSIIDNRKEV